MATLIAVYNSEGCVGRCDARCYNAIHVRCDCICGGKNHGAGLNQATDNVRRHADIMIERWATEHPGAHEFQVLPKPVQTELF
jgi:hypothetical protein